MYLVIKFLWRIRFVIKYKKVFSKPKGAFNSSISHGWEVSGKVYDNLGHLSPESAAIEEITRWYCD